MSPGLRLLTGGTARLAVALGLTAYVLWRSNPAAVLAAAAAARWEYIAAALLLVLVDRALMAWRWIALLDDTAAAPRPPISRLLHIFFVSTFLGTFLPASIGSDLVRTWSLSRERVGAAQAAASVAMDRLLGVIALVLLAGLGLFLGRALLPGNVALFGMTPAAAGCLAGVAVVYSRRLEDALTGAAHRLPSWAGAPASKLVGAVRAYATRHRAVTTVLVASVGVNVLRILQAALLGRSVGMSVPVATYFAFVPLILVIMLLPVSIYGLGTGQLAFTWFFDLAGVPHAQSFALSMLFLGLGIVGNLPGAVLYVRDRGNRGAPAPTSRAER